VVTPPESSSTESRDKRKPLKGSKKELNQGLSVGGGSISEEGGDRGKGGGEQGKKQGGPQSSRGGALIPVLVGESEGGHTEGGRRSSSRMCTKRPTRTG